MKKGHLLQIGFLMTAMVGVSFAASAQQSDASNLPHLQAKDLRQYPSLIQISGDAVGGVPNTSFLLRCGYASSGNQMTLDPTINDLLLTNEGTHAYARYQDVEGKPVISTLDTTKTSTADTMQILVQVTESDGSIKAKSCSVAIETGTLSACAPTSPFLTVAQSNAAVEALAHQCADFVGQYTAQISPSTFDAQKTQEWKANLHQALVLIEQ